MSHGCEKCSKTFAQESAMARHVKRCSSQMIYKCMVEGCRKTFSQSSQLRAHENVHTKRKPYACGIGNCPAKFGDPSSKARHVKEIHKTTHVNVCPVAGCNTRIKRNSAYNAHLKRKHGITNIKANLPMNHPVLQSSTGTPNSNNGIESLPSSYTTSERDAAMMPLLWQSPIPQALTLAPPPQAELNNIAMYSRTQPLLGEIPEIPLVIDQTYTTHWGSDAYARIFQVDGSLSGDPPNGTMPLSSNGNFIDDLFNHYDIYNAHRISTMGPLVVSSNPCQHYSTHHIFSDPSFESAPPSAYSDLASLGLRSPTIPAL